MAHETQEVPALEQEALFKRLRDSKGLKKAEKLRELLTFLFENRDKKLSAGDIETKLRGFDEGHRLHNAGHTREMVFKLQTRLRPYWLEHPEEQVVCELPPADEAAGYQLIFKRVNTRSPTSAFWAAHIASGKEVSVICDPLLFFYRHQDGRLLRFVDTNIEGLNRAQGLSELKRLHREYHEEKLIAGHFYIDVGAVLAAEMIREHFRKSEGMHVSMLVDKDGTLQSWARSSPVLFGTTRTNTLIKRIFGAPETKDLRYRLHPDRFGWVTISEPTEAETNAINGLKHIEWEGQESFTTTSPELTLGIVSRIPNPRGGGGAMTFISSDSTRNTSQMAAALTDESQLRRIFATMKYPNNKPLPEKFEMLFFVRLWPGDQDDEAAEAELLAGCPLN